MTSLRILVQPQAIPVFMAPLEKEIYQYATSIATVTDFILNLHAFKISQLILHGNIVKKDDALRIDIPEVKVVKRLRDGQRTIR